MPNYGLPGVAIDQKRSRNFGAAVVVAVMVMVGGWQLAAMTRHDQGLHIRLHTQEIGDGIVAGAQVRADGVLVGSVTDVMPADHGTQMIDVRLDRGRLAGLDDSLRLNYATSNLFGISEIDLLPGAGGRALRDNSVLDMTGLRAAQVYDATMGALLRSMSQVGNQVLTPKLAAVVASLSSDAHAFTPLLQAIITTSRTVADHQHLPLSQMSGALGRTLSSTATFAGTTIGVIDQVQRSEPLRTDRPRLDATITMIVQQLIPTLQTLLRHGGDNFSGYTTMLAPILDAAARTVPEPERSSADLRIVLDRLRAAMPDSPDGPVLNLDLDLRGVPGLAVPLLGQGQPR